MSSTSLFCLFPSNHTKGVQICVIRWDLLFISPRLLGQYISIVICRAWLIVHGKLKYFTKIPIPSVADWLTLWSVDTEDPMICLNPKYSSKQIYLEMVVFVPCHKFSYSTEIPWSIFTVILSILKHLCTSITWSWLLRQSWLWITISSV